MYEYREEIYFCQENLALGQRLVFLLALSLRVAEK